MGVPIKERFGIEILRKWTKGRQNVLWVHLGAGPLLNEVTKVIDNGLMEIEWKTEKCQEITNHKLLRIIVLDAMNATEVQGVVFPPFGVTKG
jgi:hypothetical protein